MSRYWIAVLIVAGLVAVDRMGSRPVESPRAQAAAARNTARPSSDNVIAYAVDDPQMNAAKARARETMPRFVELIAQNTPGAYSIKFPLTQNGVTEHIWLQVDGYRSGKFLGRLANRPQNGPGLSMGDRLAVPLDRVEDWNIISGDVIYGGYTIRVALSNMPAEKAEALGKRFRD